MHLKKLSVQEKSKKIPRIFQEYLCCIFAKFNVICPTKHVKFTMPNTITITNNPLPLEYGNSD